MAMQRDPEILRKPAFMRKRSLRVPAKKVMIMTALDRKQAGVKLPALQKPKRIVARPRARLQPTPPFSGTSPGLFDRLAADISYENTRPIIEAAPLPRARRARTTPVQMGTPQLRVKAQRKPRTRAVRPTRVQTPVAEIFTPTPAPIADLRKRVVSAPVPLGTITHYFPKIAVAVLQLSAAISVGDFITFETEKGPYSQLVESMEIERVPVFTANPGDDVGMKINTAPKIGSEVSVG